MQKYIIPYSLLLVALLAIVRLFFPSFEYIGERNAAGNPHGEGVAFWHTGVKTPDMMLYDGIYKGSWNDGKREGEGEFLCHGNWYKGEWRNDDLRKGNCVIRNVEAFVGGNATLWKSLNEQFLTAKTADYEGFFFTLLPDGIGKIVCGSYAYDGQWSFGKRSGFGKENNAELALFENGEKKDVNIITDKRIYGTDLSHYQPIVHWDRMYVAVDSSYTYNDTISKQIGVIPISFVFLKATEGKEYVDAEYAKHCDWAERFGIPHGAYHFFNQRYATLQEQISNFTTNVQVKKGDLPPVLDIEQFGVSTDSLLMWCDAVEKHFGVKPIVYANEKIAAIHVDRSELKDNILWHARYGRTPTRSFHIHQYSESGLIPAIGKHEVDLDTLSMGMTVEQLLLP